MHKITNNSNKNRGSNLILNKSGRGPPKKLSLSYESLSGAASSQNIKHMSTQMQANGSLARSVCYSLVDSTAWII